MPFSITKKNFKNPAISYEGRHYFVYAEDVHLKGDQISIAYCFYNRSRSKWYQDTAYFNAENSSFLDELFQFAVKKNLIDCVPDIITEFINGSTQKSSIEVIVKAEPNVPYEDLTDDDKCVPLKTPIHINSNVESTQIADTALSHFHDNVAIQYPEHFEISIWYQGALLDETSQLVSVGISKPAINQEKNNDQARTIPEFAFNFRAILAELLESKYGPVDLTFKNTSIFVPIQGSSTTLPVHVKFELNGENDNEGVVYVTAGYTSQGRIASKRILIENEIRTEDKFSQQQISHILKRIKEEIEKVKSSKSGLV